MRNGFLKKYWVLLLLLVLIGVVLGISRYAENRKAEERNNTQTTTATVALNDAGKGTEKADKPPRRPDWIDTFAWPEGTTAWALLLTLIAIAWQSAETRVSANAAAASMKLQESNLVQWVDIEPIGVTVMTKSTAPTPDTIRLMLRWRVVNNTPLPFTVQKIQTQVAKDRNWLIYQVEEVELVPPANEGSRNFYPFFVEIDLDEKETKEFLDKGTELSIVISVFYKEASGKEEMRGFGEWYHCEASGMEIVEGLGKTPTMHVEIDDSPGTIRRTQYHEFDGAAHTPEAMEDDCQNTN